MGNRVDRGLSLRADAEQLDCRTFTRAETEQTNHAFDRRLAPFITHFDTRIETARRFTRTRSRTCMQAARVNQRDLPARLFRHIRRARLTGRVSGFASARTQHQQRRFTRLHDAAFHPLDDLERIRIRNRDHRHQTRRVQRDLILIELDQHVAGMHLRALLDHRRKALAVQLDRIDTDMQQNLRTFSRRQRHRVTGAREMGDGAVARRDQAPLERIDTDAVAEHTARKHRVGHIRQRHDRAGQRRKQNNMAFRMAHQAGLLDTSHLISRQ